MSNLSIVFPVGKKPSINFHESALANKDCYVYWDADYLKLKMSWQPIEDVEHKEVYAINKMQEHIDKQTSLIEKLYIFLDTSREGFDTDELEGLLVEINEL